MNIRGLLSASKEPATFDWRLDPRVLAAEARLEELERPVRAAAAASATAQAEAELARAALDSTHSAIVAGTATAEDLLAADARVAAAEAALEPLKHAELLALGTANVARRALNEALLEAKHRSQAALRAANAADARELEKLLVPAAAVYDRQAQREALAMELFPSFWPAPPAPCELPRGAGIVPMVIGLFHRDGRNPSEFEQWLREGRDAGYLESTSSEAPRPNVFAEAASRIAATQPPQASPPRVERELTEQGAWFESQHQQSQAQIRRLQQQQRIAAEVVPPQRSA